jgi:DNA-binding protein H-NS
MREAEEREAQRLDAEQQEQQCQEKERQEAWNAWLEMHQQRLVEASTMVSVVMGVPWSQQTPL